MSVVTIVSELALTILTDGLAEGDLPLRALLRDNVLVAAVDPVQTGLLQPTSAQRRVHTGPQLT